MPLYGRMKGLWRCHYAIAEMCQLLILGKVAHGAAYGVLLMQALTQVAIDGSWDNASLIPPTEDPLPRPRFGAEESALKSIYRYRRALKELKNQKGGREAEDDEPEEPRPGRRTKDKKDKDQK